MAYAKGKYAKFISDRSGMEYPYNEMVLEWNGISIYRNGKRMEWCTCS